ncbi:MAG TPA: hypothetical protein VIM29_07735 [Bacillota bacterium]
MAPKLKLKLTIILCWLGILFQVHPVGAATVGTLFRAEKPILIVIVDKLDGLDFFGDTHPGIQQLLRESASGLMSIRSGFGYTKANSAYLTIGSGIRSAAPDELSGLWEGRSQYWPGLTAQDFWSWNTDPQTAEQNPKLVVPEFGWVFNLERNGKRAVVAPGRLGTILHRYGWKTFLFGNVDYKGKKLRPGGLLLMDRAGIVDGGIVTPTINVKDPNFPYLSRLDTAKTFEELQKNLNPKTLAVVEFSDFARLDAFREEILPEQYQNLKNAALDRLGEFIGRIMEQWTPEQLSLLLLTPSLPKEAYSNKRLLAPIIIRSSEHHGGILTSGTTNWPGIISNFDILPTLLKLARINLQHSFEGRPVRTEPHQMPHQALFRLYQRINSALAAQRPILDWYLGLIAGGWLLGMAALYLKLGKIGDFVLTGIATVPLALLLLPLLPPWSWQVPGFLILTLVLNTGFVLISNYQSRFLVLAALTWLWLVVDQFTGWNLIRFSALGYSPAAGARYYGMGNEFMGVFLILALILANLIHEKTRCHWPGVLILVCTIMVLGAPKLGVNFGGTLAAITGSLFYLFRAYRLNLKSRKVWLVSGSGLLFVLALGCWDAFRLPEQQTHVGRFFQLIISNRLNQVLLIFQRKVAMNLKLLMVSPWARILWLGLGLAVVNRLVTKANLVNQKTRLLWDGILVTGCAAFALNDSGTVAVATGMAFAFSYLLIAFGNRNAAVE